jgi:selT/selW/selH-like putative selenoprotein
LEAEIRSAHPAAQIELVRGSGGIFDVTVDGRRVFSKHETGRFPAPGEVLRSLA